MERWLMSQCNLNKAEKPVEMQGDGSFGRQKECESA
jgi:hypothetical protein